MGTDFERVTEVAEQPAEPGEVLPAQTCIRHAFRRLEATFYKRANGVRAPKISRLGDEDLADAYLALPAQAYSLLCDHLARGSSVVWLCGSIDPVDLMLDLLACRSSVSIHRLCSGELRENDWPRLAHFAGELWDVPLCFAPGVTDLDRDRALEAAIAANFGLFPNHHRVLVSQHASALFEDFDLPVRRPAAAALAGRLNASVVFVNGSCCQCALVGVACVEHGVQAWTRR